LMGHSAAAARRLPLTLSPPEHLEKHVLPRYIRSDFKDLPPYTPIKPFDVVAEEIGVPISDIVKLDANENVYGPIPEVIQAINAIQSNHIYPDPGQTYLRTAIAKRHNIPKEMVICGCGADDIIDILIRSVPNRPIVITGPTFGMYSFLGSISKRTIIDVPRVPETFEVDFDQTLKVVCESHASILFLTSPNNPTGDIISNDIIKRLCDSTAHHCLVVIDEAYAEFSNTTCIPLINQFPNLVVLRTFSKWAALAGLRVGYSVSNALIARCMDVIKQPYNVSSVADIAAQTALQYEHKIKTEHIDKIIAERDNLYQVLTKYSWLSPVPNSQANFILCRVVNRPAWLVASSLREKGILIRYYSTKHLVQFVRFSVGRPIDTQKLKEGLDNLDANCITAYLKSCEGLLWDMDGILANVSQSYRSAIIETAKFWNVTVTHQDIDNIKAQGDANNDWIVSKRVIDFKIQNGPSLAQVTQKFEEIYQGTSVTPGLWSLETLVPTRQLLNTLKAVFPKMGIVTGRPRSDANKFIDTFKLNDLFDVVICMEDTLEPKQIQHP